MATTTSLSEPLYEADGGSTPVGSGKPTAKTTGAEVDHASSAPGTTTPKATNAHKRLSLSRLSFTPEEPIELQIETMSPAAGRAMFLFWYLLLALAIVVQSIVSLQWQSTNMCNDKHVSLTDIGSWQSGCAMQVNYTVVNPATNDTERFSDVVWTGFIETDPLARFLHLVFSMQNPNTTQSRTYTIAFGYAITNTTNDLIRKPNKTAIFNIECKEGQARCSTVVMATETTGRPNATHVTLTAVGVDADIATLMTTGSAVGTVHQKRSYTIASIVLRYTLMFFSLLHLARFLYHKKFTNTLYEQTWISLLHGGLFLYLDPLFAAGVYIVPEPNVLSFLEFRVPTYFMALMVAFMFSLITSSMSWTSATSLYNPPWWTKIASLIFLLAIFTLDIVDASMDNWSWNLEHCPNFSCNTLGYFLYGLLILGVLICTVWLYWLRNNLGLKPYLDSRPQQLAVRVFIFMFSTTVLYFVIQSLTIFFGFRDISGIVTYQALVQIPPILVSVFFVNIMTLVYTTTVRTQRVPIRPSDLRWKRAVWPESWYQWLSRHGGSMYIFYTEEEEAHFYHIQTKFAARRAKAKAQDANNDEAGSPGAPEIIIADDSTGTPLSPGESKIRFDLRDEVYNDEDNVSSEDDSVDDDEDVSERTPPRSPLKSPRRSPRNSPRTSPQESPTRPTASSFLLVDNDERKKKKKKKSGKKNHRIASKIPGGERIMDAVSHVTRSVSRLVDRAENELVDRTATFIDAVENRLIDTFNTKVRHKPFFNLEMATDCLNLSWEAYGVAVSLGDEMITTGVNVRLPEVEPAAKKTMQAIASAFSCFSLRPSPRQDAPTPSASESEHHQNSHHDMSDRQRLTPDPESTTRDRSPSREYGATSLPAASPSSKLQTPPINVAQYGYTCVAVAEREDVQVVVSKMDMSFARHHGKWPRIVVAFRGTDNVKNAKQDLDIRRVFWDEVDHSFWQSASASRPSVHVGFLGIWNSLREFVLTTVLEELGKTPDTPHRVVVTGHSMGGAVGTLCAFAIHKRLLSIEYPLPDPCVYTYGQPRIGNKSFQKTYNKAVPNTFRVVNESDAVSFVTMFGGCHVGMEVDIDRNGNFICEPMFMERTLRPMKGKGSAFANHMLNAYAESLNGIANKVNMCESRCLVPYVVLATPRSSPGEKVADRPLTNE